MKSVFPHGNSIIVVELVTFSESVKLPPAERQAKLCLLLTSDSLLPFRSQLFEVNVMTILSWRFISFLVLMFVQTGPFSVIFSSIVLNPNFSDGLLSQLSVCVANRRVV